MGISTSVFRTGAPLNGFSLSRSVKKEPFFVRDEKRHTVLAGQTTDRVVSLGRPKVPAGHWYLQSRCGYASCSFSSATERPLCAVSTSGDVTMGTCTSAVRCTFFVGGRVQKREGTERTSSKKNALMITHPTLDF